MSLKYSDTIVMHEDLLSGEQLHTLQKNSNISVTALSRMTGLSRSSIYRVFENEACTPYNLLIRLALDHPDIFVLSEKGEL